jgi:beta-lactamase class A
MGFFGVSAMPTLRSLEGQYKAKISLLWQPIDGTPIAYHADRPVKTASIIKLPILVHAALLVDAGQLSWNQRVPLDHATVVPGMGVLRYLDAGIAPTVRDLAVLMTIISDNTATNILIDMLGIEKINERIQTLGMTQTRLNRKVFTPNTPDCLPWGLGVTTARDTVHLLQSIVTGQIGTPETNLFLRDTLAHQLDRVGFPRGMPRGWTYAGKTGSDDDLRNDCGILTAPDGSIVIAACFVQELAEAPSSVDHPGLKALSDVAALMTEA